MSRDAERRSADQLERLFDLSVDMLGTASNDGYFTRLNPAWERTLGWPTRDLMAAPILSFVHPDDVEATIAASVALAQPSQATLSDFENRFRCSDGAYRWIQWTVVASEGARYFVAKDVTERRAADIERNQAAGVMAAILESVADGLYVADERGEMSFVNRAAVALLGYESDQQLIGRSPHSTFHHTRSDGAPYPIEDCPLAQVRVTGAPVHVEEDGFWRRDGSALAVSYSSAPIELEGGTGSVVAFRDVSERVARDSRVRRELEAVSWVGRIRDALDEDRLVLYAQPIVDLATGATVQHELLVRMIDANGDVVTPGNFLGAAEQHGLIGEIDLRVFEKALRYAAAGHRVQINFSADSISEPGLFRVVEEQLRLHAIDPQLLTFEITETALIHNEDVARVFIENVRRLGCGVALDDFGTGYGSFRYLKHLPVTHLKIDLEFIRDLDGPASMVNRHVIGAIVTLARGMGQKTTAEGVETDSALRQLRELGVDYAQGYYFARPAPADEVLMPTELKEPVDA